MNSLTEHIEYLLTQHDCIVIPGFGGIVLRAQEAFFTEGETLFPPCKSAGFNPGLTHNDGLLANSLMIERNISFNEAMILIELWVKELHAALLRGETIKLESIGTFSMNEHQSLTYNPAETNLFDLDLFGFETLSLTRLQPKETTEVTVTPETTPANPDILLIPVNLRFLRHVSAAVLILIGLLFVSHPLEDKRLPDNYASIISSDWIRKSIVPAVSVPAEEVVLQDPVILTEEESVSDVSQLTPEVVSDNESAETGITLSEPEKVPVPVPAPEPPVIKEKRYYIVIGSFPSLKQAQERMQTLSDQGIKGVEYLKKDNKYRIYVNSFVDKQQANRFLEDFRLMYPSFKDAWLLMHR